VRALVAVCGFPAALVTWGVWAALLIGYLGLHGWPFDLFANFRVQYMAILAICVVALTIVRWRKTALVALVGVAFTTASMAPYFTERPALPPPQSRVLTLLTFNTWFRNDNVDAVANFLERSGADVLVLQEVDVPRLSEFAALLPSYPHHTATPKVRRGLAIFSRTPISGIEHFEIPERVTRITRARVEWEGQQIVVFGAHLRWPISRFKAHQRAFELTMLAEHVKRETGPVLVAGDFNLTPWSQHFTRFLDASSLNDCAVGQGLLPTWPSQFWPARIRIDHCFASQHWQIRDMKLGPSMGSDHLPTIVQLELKR